MLMLRIGLYVTLAHTEASAARGYISAGSLGGWMVVYSRSVGQREHGEDEH